MTDGQEPAFARARAATALWFVDLTSAAAVLDDAEANEPRLATDEIARFEKIASRDAEQARLWRAAHIALRIALERHAGLSVRAVPYDLELSGRPRLPRGSVAGVVPHFSLSHSGTHALIAISREGPIGVDLERARMIAVTQERRQRIEIAAIHLAPTCELPTKADDRFLQAWVRLEAVAKATGLGIGRILTEAGVVGGRHVFTSEKTGDGPFAVRDLDVRASCFAAVSAVQLPQLLAVEEFPSDAAQHANFLKPVSADSEPFRR